MTKKNKNKKASTGRAPTYVTPMTRSAPLTTTESFINLANQYVPMKNKAVKQVKQLTKIAGQAAKNEARADNKTARGVQTALNMAARRDRKDLRTKEGRGVKLAGQILSGVGSSTDNLVNNTASVLKDPNFAATAAAVASAMSKNPFK
jgi:hypothetical protein